MSSECFVKLSDSAKVITAIDLVCQLLIVALREGHRAAARIACSEGPVSRELDVSAAHLAFQYRHIVSPL
jgi:hypothetical protein